MIIFLIAKHVSAPGIKNKKFPVCSVPSVVFYLTTKCKEGKLIINIQFKVFQLRRLA